MEAMKQVGLLALGAASTLVTLTLFGDEAKRSFRPPTIAVADTSAIFEKYRKKSDLEAEGQKQLKAIQPKLAVLEQWERRRKEIESEIGKLGAGVQRKELELEKLRLELEVKSFKERELKELEEAQVRRLREIRGDIDAAIQAYARTHQLDLVLERKIAGGPPTPICHFVSPELDITADVLQALEAAYKQP